MCNTFLQVAGFLDHSTVNGSGFRATLFLSGCSHHCPGCHNLEAQAFDFGEQLSLATILKRIDKNLPLIDGVTLSGGDPFFQAPQVLVLLEALKKRELDVWVYTGFTYDALLVHPVYHKLLPLIDVLVDGPYIAALHTTTHRYIGSSNQRILKLYQGKIEKICHFEY